MTLTRSSGATSIHPAPWARRALMLTLWLVAAMLASGPLAAQGGGPMLAGGGGPTLEVFLLAPGKFQPALDLPEMLLLQGGGGFGRYQAWRVGGSGAAGQVSTPAGDTFSLSYGGVSFAYLPGAYGAVPLPSPRTSFGALFGLGAASLQSAETDPHSLPFVLFRPEAAFEVSLGSLGTFQAGVTYTFPIPLGSDEALGDLRAIQQPGFRVGLVFGGF